MAGKKSLTGYVRGKDNALAEVEEVTRSLCGGGHLITPIMMEEMLKNDEADLHQAMARFTEWLDSQLNQQNVDQGIKKGQPI